MSSNTFIDFYSAGSYVTFFPVRIVKAGYTDAFGNGSVDKHIVGKIKAYMGNDFPLSSTEKYQVSFAEIVSAAKRFYTTCKKLLYRGAWYFNMVNIAKQPLYKCRAINAILISPAPEVRRMQPFVNEAVKGQIGDTVRWHTQVAGIFLPEQLVSHHGRINSIARNGNCIAFQNDGLETGRSIMPGRAAGYKYGTKNSNKKGLFHKR